MLISSALRGQTVAVIMAFMQLLPEYRTEEKNGGPYKFKLLSGDLMPLIGLGTYSINGEQVKKVLDSALEIGYRQIDTAALYKNEKEIGDALKELLPKYNISRSDIFITTKLAPDDLGDTAYSALENSLKRLQLDYVDLYLIHTPQPFTKNNITESFKDKRDRSWQQLVKAKNDGLAKNIGVSNYHVHHLNELLANDHGVKPVVNQFEWNPLYHPSEVQELCNKEGILLEAYSSLGSGRKNLLNIPEVKQVADKLGKSPAQVLLRWAVQQNVAVIPRSASKKHLQDNFDLDFVIPDNDMNILSGLQQEE